MPVVAYTKPKNGSSTMTFRVEGEHEIKAYRSLLYSDVPKCPECMEELIPKDENLFIQMTDPEAKSFLDIGKAITMCDHCKAKVTVPGEIMVDCFPSIMKVLKQLRTKNKETSR